MEKEIWRDIEGYEGLYAVSNLGRVKSFRYGKETILKPTLSGKKYQYHKVGLWDSNREVKQIAVHKIIVLTFPEICGVWYKGCEIDHIDTNRFNNRADNLKVCTPKENHNNQLTIRHLSETMKAKPKEYFLERNAYKKKKVICTDTGEIFNSIKEAAEKTGAISEVITKICKHKKNQYGNEYKTSNGLHFEYV